MRFRKPNRIVVLLLIFAPLAARGEGSPLSSTIPNPASVGIQSWTLEDVIKIALEKNSDLQAANANYDAAAKGIGIAVSVYLPHIDLTARYDDTTLPSPSAGSAAQLGIGLPYRSVIVSVNQVIFDFGKALSNISANRATSSAAEQEAVSVRNAVKLAVQKAFYDVQSTKQLVAVSNKALVKYQEIVRRAEVLVHTGAKPKFDLTQAKVENSKAKLVLISTQNANEFAKIALLDLMGIRDTIPFELLETTLVDHAETSDKLHLDHLIDRALVARPEIQGRQYTVEAAMAQRFGEMKNYLPTVSLQAWGGRYYSDYPLALDNSWGVAVVGSWHVFSGLETMFRVGQDAAIVDRERAHLEGDRLEIIAEVTRAYKELDRSEKSFDVANEALLASQENLHLAQRRYEADVATILELLTAENSLLSAESSFVTSRYDHEIALASLHRAVNAPLLDEEASKK